MLLFAAHDPGARNHIRPIYEHSLTLGEASEFVDLSSSNELMGDHEASLLVRALQPELLIAGCSSNRAEWALIRACTREGVKAITMIDIVPGRKLVDIPCVDFPARFMVTSAVCKEELIACGARREDVLVTGSAHLEQMSKCGLGKTGCQIKQSYNVDNNSNIVPFFCAPDADDSIDALDSLASLIPTIPLNHPTLILRPHPRTTQVERLEYACRQFEFVRYDPGNRISRADLLRASQFSLTMGSTVSLESLVLGTPSAFYQIGWDFQQLDRDYRNVDIVPRIRNPDQLIRFVASVLDEECVFNSDDIEYYDGALSRIWEVIREFREQSRSK